MSAGRWCSSEKEVLVAVYEERSRLLPEEHGGRHRHRRHLHVGVNKNRRAELLEYARHLRASSPQIKQPSTLQISSSCNKNPPTCFDKWECIIPSFLRSITAFKEKGKKNRKKKTVSTTKLNALVKSLQVQKGNFLSQLFTTLKKRRR